MAALRSFRNVLFSAVRSQQNLFSVERPAYLQRFKQTVPLQKAPTSETKYLINWELNAAVCLTRLPLVSPNLSQIEESYMKLLQNQEFERSVLSDWEVEKLRQNEIIKAVESGDSETERVDFKITHEDIEDEFDAKMKEYKNVELASESERDEDLKNINRKVRDALTYVVKKKLGSDEVWVMPLTPIDDGETMRECAERAMSLHSLDQYQGTILSNAPSAYFKYKFPKEVRLKNTGVGAKVFIFTALLKNIDDSAPQRGVDSSATMDESSEKNDDNILDHAWVTKDELSKLLKPKYFEAIRKILT